MHITRLVAGTVTAGLLGLTPLAVSAPANATDNLTTTVTLEQNYGSTRVTYGEEVSFISEVTASDGGSPYNEADTVTLWAMPAGTSTWTAVESQPGSGYISWTNFKPQQSTAYKVTYSGGTATSTLRPLLAESAAERRARSSTSCDTMTSRAGGLSS